ncbi:MAG: hypothetical protein ABIS68_01015 [Casimicrobiaceae bacterium]
MAKVFCRRYASEVVGMGHAWSGGDSAVPFHDALGPDASALMMGFFSGVAERN